MLLGQALQLGTQAAQGGFMVGSSTSAPLHAPAVHPHAMAHASSFANQFPDEVLGERGLQHHAMVTGGMGYPGNFAPPMLQAAAGTFGGSQQSIMYGIPAESSGASDRHGSQDR